MKKITRKKLRRKVIMRKNVKNTIHLEGYVYEHKLAVKTFRTRNLKILVRNLSMVLLASLQMKIV